MSKKPKPPKVVWVIAKTNGEILFGSAFISQAKAYKCAMKLGTGVAVFKYKLEEPCKP